MSVTLREVNGQNWYWVTQLKVRDEQSTFVADNTFSLAQAAYTPGFVPLAVYDAADELVGFFMYGYEHDKDRWWIARLMVEQHYQGKGYGRATMVEGMRIMRERTGCKEVYVSYEYDNPVARNLYRSLGFEEVEVENGEMVHAIYENEQVAVLRLPEVEHQLLGLQ
jgi:diamine N-acetyltransferase